MISEFQQHVDQLIDTLEGIGDDELCRTDTQAIRLAIDLIKAVRDLGPDVASLNEEDYEQLLLEAMGE